ncbi:DNA methylase [Synechococcus phage S-H9-2]|uniref:site-specific DNA-methyltransferase (cytosine-N(4)-specific) n=1 Tax=Synechococcus phage S-H9-2 TaxID=2783669 RepID=A0A873WAZ2_9CAUD|nr:methyltransferase [Synechococcus phage S-H9-2]QPB08407.1 DNA methylase [Synechococcus phage S-H9-2]
MNEIICSDSLVALKEMDDESVDIVLTSPPYNYGMEYDTHDDDGDADEYLEKILAVFVECKRVLKSGGRLIINIQPNYKQYFPTHHKITQRMIAEGMIWRGEIIWLKNNLRKLTAWGSWKSPSCPYLSYPFEFIEVFSKDTLKHPGNKEDIDITKDEFIKYVNGHWSMAPETKMKDYGHPAMFPEELVERCLKLFSYKGDVVLDPFNGAGTTTYVAHKLGRKYIGIDMSKSYCETAELRIAKHAPLDKFLQG